MRDAGRLIPYFEKIKKMKCKGQDAKATTILRTNNKTKAGIQPKVCTSIIIGIFKSAANSYLLSCCLNSQPNNVITSLPPATCITLRKVNIPPKS